MASTDRVARTGDLPEAFVRPNVPHKYKIFGRMGPPLSKIVTKLYPDLESFMKDGWLYFEFA
jgi:hypothetical protein